MVVADDAAEQTIVGRRDPVVAVERDGGQGRDVDAVDALGRGGGCERGVEAGCPRG